MKRIIGAAAAVAAVAALFTAACQQQASSDPGTVKLATGGTVVGTVEDGVAVFKGVPFAQPPVGDLRWRPPQPISWDGERQATSFALPCPQPINEDGSANGGGVSGDTSEDCLYLNVWAPADAKNAPVMMWLYGGAGYLGAGHLGSYQGTHFAKNGVIIVTINYRLGDLGSFAHPAITAAANGDDLDNYALMDAIAGLKWIKDNIGAFGGDANNVTLFGQSAGGSMVSRLLSSPDAKGLFQKAIVHSGANLRGGMTQQEGEARGAEIATALGLDGANATLEQLRAIDPKQFTDNKDIRAGVPGVLDGKILTESTADALKDGSASDVPLIVGSNMGEPGVANASNMVNLARDGAPSYQYYFTYTPAWRAEEWPNGPPHSAEIPYAFAALDTSTTGGGDRVTDAEWAVANEMNSCWVAFAKSAPDAKSITCADGFVWEPRGAEGAATAVFGAKPEMQDLSDKISTEQAAMDARAAAAAAAK